MFWFCKRFSEKLGVETKIAVSFWEKAAFKGALISKVLSFQFQKQKKGPIRVWSIFPIWDLISHWDLGFCPIFFGIGGKLTCTFEIKLPLATK